MPLGLTRREWTMSEAKKRILITGATGQVGGLLIMQHNQARVLWNHSVSDGAVYEGTIYS